MQGGEFISSGTYGCTFTPHLKCGRAKNIPTGTVGKIFRDTYSFKQEVKLDSLVKKLDPDNLFTVPYYGTCVTDITKARPDDHIEKCSLISDPHIKQGQVLLAFGGKPIVTVVSQGLAYIDDFIAPMYNLYAGIKTIQKHRYAHSDIKSDNILFNVATRRMALIDFGLLTKMSKLKKEYNALVHNYMYYPPEMKIMAIASIIKNYTQGYIRTFIEQNFMEIPRDTLYKLVPSYRRNLDAFIKRAMDMKYQDYAKEFNKEYIQKLDTYSLSMSFLECFTIGRVRNDKLVREFLTTVIFPAIHPDPKMRLSIDEILMRYTHIIQKFGLSVPGPLSQDIKNKTVSYQKDFKDCKKSEAKGGYGIKELRNIAKKAGITAKTRDKICDELTKLQKK